MALAATTPRETPLARILGDASIEIIAGHSGVPTLSSDYAPGTRVHVTFLPSDDLSTAAETCVALRRGGFEPVPHLTARNFASRDVLERHLARLTGEAGVTRALVIAGDVDRPRGELKTSMDVLKTGLLERHGIKSILLAGHPEGHPAAANDVLDAALRDKIAFARAGGLGVEIVTQFCFEAEPVLAWLERIRAARIDAPLRVGVAGPAGTATLLKFALRCGIGNSLRALRKRPGVIAMATEQTDPEGLLCDFAAGVDEGIPVSGIHLYTFGGLRKTASWLNAARARAAQA